jgi:Activator of Hsp90 ATPase, N-terminal
LILTLFVTGFANGKETEVKGKIDIPNLSEEHEDMADVDLDVSLTTKGPESELLKEMLRKGSGAAKLRETLGAYVTALKTEYSQGLILPKKGENGTTTVNSNVSSSSLPREIVVT